MRHLSIALIVLAVLGADFMSHWLDMAPTEMHGWSVTSSIALVYAAFALWDNR